MRRLVRLIGPRSGAANGGGAVGWGDAKAVQPEAAGKLAGGKGGSYPLAGGSDDPSQFIRIDRAFCVELPSVATDELAGGRQ